MAQGVADKKSALGNAGHVSSGIRVDSSKIIDVPKGCKDSEMRRVVVKDVLLIGNSSNIIGHRRTGKPTDLIKGTRNTTKRSSKKDSKIYGSRRRLFRISKDSKLTNIIHNAKMVIR